MTRKSKNNIDRTRRVFSIERTNFCAKLLKLLIGQLTSRAASKADIENSQLVSVTDSAICLLLPAVFVLFFSCLGCPEQLIKLFANSPGQARKDTGPEVSIYL